MTHPADTRISSDGTQTYKQTEQLALLGKKKQTNKKKTSKLKIGSLWIAEVIMLHLACPCLLHLSQNFGLYDSPLDFFRLPDHMEQKFSVFIKNRISEAALIT